MEVSVQDLPSHVCNNILAGQYWVVEEPSQQYTTPNIIDNDYHTMNVHNSYKDGIVLAPAPTIFGFFWFYVQIVKLGCRCEESFIILGEKGNHIYISIDHTLCCHLIDQIIVNKHEF